MTSNGYGVAVLPGESWALLPRSLEIGTSRFWETGGQILRLGLETQKFPPATSPSCPPHSITHHSVCLQCRSVSRAD